MQHFLCLHPVQFCWTGKHVFFSLSLSCTDFVHKSDKNKKTINSHLLQNTTVVFLCVLWKKNMNKCRIKCDRTLRYHTKCSSCSWRNAQILKLTWFLCTNFSKCINFYFPSESFDDKNMENELANCQVHYLNCEYRCRVEIHALPKIISNFDEFPILFFFCFFAPNERQIYCYCR